MNTRFQEDYRTRSSRGSDTRLMEHQGRYENGRGRESWERPRDENGRFEPEYAGGRREDEYERYGSESSRSQRAWERPRDENGRFESQGQNGRWTPEWSRDEYGRFDSEPREFQFTDRAREQPNYGRDSYGRYESQGNNGGSIYGGYGNSRNSNGRAYSQQWDSSMDSYQSRMNNGGSWDERGGEFAGKGPKGYKRSDDRVIEDVCEALSRDSRIDASEIEVKAENGEVVLSGTVSDRRFKRMAEEVAERCSGVNDVRNEIRVQREHSTSSSEANGHAGAQSRTRQQQNGKAMETR